MSSLTLGPRASGQAVGRRAPVEGAVTARDVSSRTTATVTGPVPDRSQREGAREIGRVLAATLAAYAFLVVLSVLVLILVLLAGLFLGVLTTLFSGVV